MVMDESLAETLKYLRLGGLLANWDEHLGAVQKKRLSPVAFLKYVLEEERRIKGERARELRLKRAKIPEHLAIETYPFDRQPKLSRKKIMSLYDGFDYMSKKRNVVWIGGTGVGKTGLATGFLIQAIDRGFSGRHVFFRDLLAELYSSVADHSEEKVLKRYLAYDCLLIDELGYVEVESVQVGLFFTLMHKRHRKKSTLITSNLGFSEWGTFLKNDHLTVALVDRLTEESHVIMMKGCKSLRPKIE